MRAKNRIQNLCSLPDGTELAGSARGSRDVELFVVFQTSHVLPVAIPCDPINVFFGLSGRILTRSTTLAAVIVRIGSRCVRGPFLRVFGSPFRGQDIAGLFLRTTDSSSYGPSRSFFPQCRNFSISRMVTLLADKSSLRLQQERLLPLGDAVDEVFDYGWRPASFEFLRLGIVQSARSMDCFYSLLEDLG